MTDPRSLEALFVDYRRAGTPAALAELFDRAAPELLRVACHVARDLATAEDLVQQAFLTAIESAPRFDERRRVLPWLLGILANHARNGRRSAARVGELRVLPGGGPIAPGRSVAAAAGLRELDAVVQRELELLAEPYREVAILTLRHELAPAEIARALGRSPGTVRVQLHRALEQLRQRLPRGAALASWVAPSLVGEIGRGLLAVRVEVVAAAKVAAVAATAVGGASIGSLLVISKKVIGVALVLSIGAGAYWLQRGPDPVVAPDDGRASAAKPDDDGAGASPLTLPLAERTADERVAPMPAVQPADVVATLVGDVVDGERFEPLAGASIEFFAPLQMTLDEATRRFGDYAHQKIRSVGQLQFPGNWPRFVLPLPPDAWPDGAPVELCAPPEPGVTALVRATAGADGRFALALPRATGVVVVSHPGFERQVVALPLEASATAATAAAPQELSIALQRVLPLVGVVVDDRGAPLGESLRLRFITVAEEPRARHAGPWLVDTDEQGAFKASIGAARVEADCVTPGFQVVSRRTVLAGRTTTHPTTLVPGDLVAPATIVVRRLPVLKVIDARSGQPIESMTLLATSIESGLVAFHGRVHAPRGRIELAEGPRPQGYLDPRKDPLRVALWTAHHAPGSIDLPPSDQRTSVTVALEPGEPPQIAGTVVRGGVAVAGARVSLNGYYPLAWRQDDLERLDEVATDDHGSFLLRGAPGKYIVRVVAADSPPVVRMVELPAAAPFLIDLAAGGAIAVVVRDPAGTPRHDAKVYVRFPSQRSQEGYSDESGSVRFEGLEPGSYQVTLNGTRELHIPLPQAIATVAVADGATTAVELTAPPAGPIHLRIVAAGTSDFTGWRACEGMYLQSEWHDLDAAGRLAADSAMWPMIVVAAPGGFRWQLPLPVETLARGVVELPISDVGYRGRVVDRVSGRPLAGAVVRASLASSDASLSAIVDATGSFELANLDAVVYSLSVRRDPKSDGSDTPAWFKPSQPAAPGGREVVLRVPEVRGDRVAGMERRLFRGRVTRRSDGAPLVNARLMVTARWSDDDGEWGVAVEGAHARSGADGRYQVVVARATEYLLWAKRDDAEADEPAVRDVWRDIGGSGEVEERDIVLD